VINMISATVSETAGFAEAWKVIIGTDLRALSCCISPRFAGWRTIWSIASSPAARPHRHHAIGASDASQLAE